jgi:hypothetical protein
MSGLRRRLIRLIRGLAGWDHSTKSLLDGVTSERIRGRGTLPEVLNARYLDRTALSAAAFIAS